MYTQTAYADLVNYTRRINKMKKVLFALPLVALMFAVACKKQEAATAEQPAAEQVAGAATVAAPAVEAAPAPAAAEKPAEKKGK